MNQLSPISVRLRPPPTAPRTPSVPDHLLRPSRPLPSTSHLINDRSTLPHVATLFTDLTSDHSSDHSSALPSAHLSTFLICTIHLLFPLSSYPFVYSLFGLSLYLFIFPLTPY